MFLSKLESDRRELEIVYDVQWKTPGNDHDKAKIIGILDTPDTYLDWNTFKSYLIQNSGNMHFTTDDIRISYVDSDDDLIPIDSELEFRECLKFSRKRARQSRKVVMKVNMMSNGGAKPKEPSKHRDDYVPKNSKPTLFCLKKNDLTNKLMSKHNESFDKGCGSDTGSNKNDVPGWFESYMTKFKTEVVQEITAAVLTQLTNSPNVHGHSRRSAVSDHAKSHFPIIEKRKKKKKMHEEDSSDYTDGLQLHWDEKPTLPKYQVTKREKKYEKKLDLKLEKLENKTKKIIEKKSHLFSDRSMDLKRSKAKKTLIGNRMMCGDLMMNAMPVNEYSYIQHVQRGALIEQVWEVINNGQFSWGEETELRYAWGSKSLIPLTTVVKCPHLDCGETGKVKVSLIAPMFVGNYESYWYFHHQGHRFGHWLGCAVIVDPDQQPETPVAMDLTMKCPKFSNIHNPDYTFIYDGKPCVDLFATEQLLKKDDSKPDVDLKTVTENMSNLAIGENMIEMTEKANAHAKVDSTECEKLYPVLPLEQNILAAIEVKDDEKSVLFDSNTFSTCENQDTTDQSTNNQIQITDTIAKTDESNIVNDPEYVSGSSSDDMSILSGTVSVDDSEPSDEFVVVNMPACFDFDKPLDEETLEPAPVMQPISVEIPTTSAEPVVHESDNNNNMELKTFPELPPFLPLDTTSTDSKNQESGYSEGETEENIVEKEPEPSAPAADDAFTVYGTDHSGRSVPVARIIKPPEENATSYQNVNSERSSDNFSEKRRSYSNSSSSSSTHFHQNSFHEQSGPHVHTESHVFEQKFRFPMNCGPHQGDFSQYNGSWCPNCSHKPACDPNIHTEQPRSAKYSYTFEKNRESAEPNVQSRRPHENREFSPVAAAVNILPETLVTGAAHVASSAINTARTVIDMLRPRHDHIVTGHWDTASQPFEASLQILKEMGFENRTLNLALLKKFENDLTKVISELVK